jgi:O-succinylbenzoic acid--CoA ligase
VPTQLRRLLEAGETPGERLRVVLLGGAPATTELLRRARDAGWPVRETYGLTQACSQVTVDGFPLPGVHVSIAPDGEILVEGPTVAGGGVLRTGDLGRIDGHRLTVIGRKSDTIVTGGENVAPAEVEAALESHPGVLEAAVVARPDAEWGEAIVALVRRREDAASPPSEDELRDHCAARLARFKVPKAYIFIDEPLPRTGSGKLVRRRLAADGLHRS